MSSRLSIVGRQISSRTKRVDMQHKEEGSGRKTPGECAQREEDCRLASGECVLVWSAFCDSTTRRVDVKAVTVD